LVAKPYIGWMTDTVNTPTGADVLLTLQNGLLPTAGRP
jgi:hypothetical protein